MDWYDVAITIEIEGEKFYRELSEQAETEGMTNIFNLLADAEVQHKQQFEAMKAGGKVHSGDTAFREKAQQIFKTFQKGDGEKEQSQLEMYQKALEVEKKSIDYYDQQLEAVEDPSHKQALEQIISEERSHYSVIDTLVIMVQRPHEWVEDAEFGLRNEY